MEKGRKHEFGYFEGLVPISKAKTVKGGFKYKQETVHPVGIDSFQKCKLETPKLWGSY